MDYFKKIERSVTISADKRSTVDLQVDVWSQDLNVTKFILKLDTTDSATIDLMNATVRVAMFYSHDGQDITIETAGIVEDMATQKIAYIMSNRLAGFEGTVTAGFYVTLSTGQRIDIQNVTFNMRKSLLDKDLDVPTENYYQTFDDIVADVQSSGDTAKTQIAKVLPSVQSKVSAINAELAKIDENMPDLFVAYANSADGSVGFSKIKKNIDYNAYLNSFYRYIGYSVKNSINPSDYRWTVNPEWQQAQLDYEKASMIQDKLVNLIPNADFSQGLNNWYKSVNTNSLNINGDYLTIVKNDGITGSIGVYANGSAYMAKGNQYYISAEFRSTEGYYGVFLFDAQTINRPSDVDASTFHKYSKLIVPDTDFTIRLYAFNNQTYDMRKPILYNLTSIFGKGNEPSLEEFERLLSINVNGPTIYSQSILKAKLNSNPINSILTTLSAENPSTTLGGTWVQLGTETKFSNTIYYWKRTN